MNISFQLYKLTILWTFTKPNSNNFEFSTCFDEIWNSYGEMTLTTTTIEILLLNRLPNP